MTVKLIRSVGDKMKGFSRKETVDYYKSIMERAWQQVEAADTPEVKSKMFEEALEWTMLDKDFDDRTRRTFTGPVFVPMWWGRYDPSWGHTGGGVSAPSIPSCIGWSQRWITRLGLCCFGGLGHAEHVQQRDRQREHLHQRRDQRHQPASPTLTQQRWLVMAEAAVPVPVRVPAAPAPAPAADGR